MTTSLADWKVFEASATATAQDNFASLTLRMALPPNLKKPKHLLCLITGLNDDGRSWWEDPAWRAFGEKYAFPIFCVHMTMRADVDFQKLMDGDQAPSAHYVAAHCGSGVAFLKLVQQLLAQAGFSDTAELPFYLFGHSAGGVFNYNLCRMIPERIKAFTVNKGGMGYLPPSEGMLKVPGIFFLGENDSDYRLSTIRGAYEWGSVKKAPWVLVREGNQAHSHGLSPAIARAFFEEILAGFKPQSEDPL